MAKTVKTGALLKSRENVDRPMPAAEPLTLTAAMTRKATDRKIIRVSNKRQITIPQTYYDKLGFESDAVCYIDGDSIVVKPIARVGRDFSEFILADLIQEGYQGEELLDEFIRRQAQIRPALDSMIKEAEQAALDPANFTTIDELFAEDV